jgi:uncharacterized protein YgbK (DUF1537 family)
MIAVIADDLTGAAEIAGVALRNGQGSDGHKGSCKRNADVLVIATDTRSKSIEEAKIIIAEVTRELVALNRDDL